MVRQDIQPLPIADMEVETTVPHMQQRLSIPLSDPEVSQNSTHYPHDPDTLFRLKRLPLIVARKRPPSARWDR